MNDFLIATGRNTPEVKFTADTGVVSITGRSYPEDARRFYDELLTKLRPLTNAKTFNFEFNFEYLSSSSVVCILEMLKALRHSAPLTDFTIKFLHDAGDTDMVEIGENYEKLSGMKVLFVEK